MISPISPSQCLPDMASLPASIGLVGTCNYEILQVRSGLL
jgi:hypothetical protein